MPKNPPIIVSRDLLARHNKNVPPTLIPSVPLDVIHEIALYMSPRDLLRLSRTNKTIHHMLRNNESYWKNARLSFPIQIPPPYKGSEYLSLATMFGGGHCSVCKKWVEILPYSWSLKLRSCSPRCTSIIESKRLATIPGRKKDSHKVHRNKFRPWLLTLEQRPGRPKRPYDEDLYRKDHLHLADQEFYHAQAISHKLSKPRGYKGPRLTLPQLLEQYKTRAAEHGLIMESSQTKLNWKFEYGKNVDRMHAQNKAFLAQRLEQETGERRHATRSRRMKQYLVSYSQDLREFTLHDWETCLNAIMKQNEHDRSVKSFFFTKHKILGCSQCPNRYFDSEGLIDHTTNKHPEIKDQMFELLTKKSLQRCTICGTYRKLFNEQGLRDHMIQKHSDEAENQAPATSG